ncbi:MAG: SixA phosphatase family protein [Burkholderiaceae bacterium]
MDLILWRHAEAEEWAEGCIDMERSLTVRGEKQAARMAIWLDRQLPEGARIVASPARRTEQTVITLGRKYKLRPEIAPDATVDQLLELAQWPDSRSAVLVVGHQPTIGQAIARLLNLAEADFPVKKGVVWWLRSRDRDGENQTVVITVQSPEFL